MKNCQFGRSPSFPLVAYISTLFLYSVHFARKLLFWNSVQFNVASSHSAFPGYTFYFILLCLFSHVFLCMFVLVFVLSSFFSFLFFSFRFLREVIGGLVFHWSTLLPGLAVIAEKGGLLPLSPSLSPSLSLSLSLSLPLSLSLSLTPSLPLSLLSAVPTASHCVRSKI